MFFMDKAFMGNACMDKACTCMDATFMTALHIRHVRHLKDIRIPLSIQERKSLILTGKNGSGKTSVLEALEKFLE